MAGSNPCLVDQARNRIHPAQRLERAEVHAVGLILDEKRSAVRSGKLQDGGGLIHRAGRQQGERTGRVRLESGDGLVLVHVIHHRAEDHASTSPVAAFQLN